MFMLKISRTLSFPNIPTLKEYFDSWSFKKKTLLNSLKFWLEIQESLGKFILHQSMQHRFPIPLLVLEMTVQRNGRAMGSQALSLQTLWVWFHDSKCSHYCGLISYHPSAELCKCLCTYN